MCNTGVWHKTGPWRQSQNSGFNLRALRFYPSLRLVPCGAQGLERIKILETLLLTGAWNTPGHHFVRRFMLPFHILLHFVETLKYLKYSEKERNTTN